MTSCETTLKIFLQKKVGAHFQVPKTARTLIQHITYKKTIFVCVIYLLNGNDILLDVLILYKLRR